ncbi:hypothetical protein AB4Y42_41775 [Paraburkholderia sp. EG286B]|uniref:hypothetical protein n=1 Tax=Paraburkholderia sp. EG286B TaxID=3237011 RepID=UPI0034D1528E
MNPQFVACFLQSRLHFSGMDVTRKLKLPSFPKYVSHSGILALGLAKEGFHQFWQFLDATQRAKR